MRDRPFVIVKTGSALPAVRAACGDFEDWIARGMALADADVSVVRVCDGESLPEPDSVSGVAVTGSSSFVSQPEPWALQTSEWLGSAVDAGTPILGICYGHQLLAHALGGRVGPNPAGRQIGTVRVDLSAAVRVDDPLLGHLPETVEVQASHVESVLELPPGATPLGSNRADPNHAFSFGACAWGLQFHPDFDAIVIRGYIEQRAEVLREEGFDPQQLMRDARDTPHGSSVLLRFGKIVCGDK
jgi:GMP synthase (glutamine-hydrolysing)